MSYTPNTWETGDVVTAQKLNNLENGVDNLDDRVETLEQDVSGIETLLAAI